MSILFLFFIIHSEQNGGSEYDPFAHMQDAANLGGQPITRRQYCNIYY